MIPNYPNVIDQVAMHVKLNYLFRNATLPTSKCAIPTMDMRNSVTTTPRRTAIMKRAATKYLIKFVKRYGWRLVMIYSLSLIHI